MKPSTEMRKRKSLSGKGTAKSLNVPHDLPNVSRHENWVTASDFRQKYTLKGEKKVYSSVAKQLLVLNSIEHIFTQQAPTKGTCKDLTEHLKGL